MLHDVVLIAVAAAAGYLFNLVHIPMGWLLGPMSVGIAYVAWKGEPRPLNKHYMTLGQAIFGLSTGVGFPLATLLAAATHGVPLLVNVVITGGLALLNGYVLWKWAGVDRATSFMGSLPGAAHAMTAMADEMGANGVMVAVLQYWRVILVMFIAPSAVHALFPPSPAVAQQAAAAAAAPAVHWALNLVALAICGALGLYAGRKLKLPSPTFLGPFLVMMVAAWTLPVTFLMPGLLFKAGMLMVGLSIGVRFDVGTARRLGRAALIETVLVLGLIAISLTVGYVFHLITGVDTLTAVLGSTPGAMDVMVASAIEMGGDSGMVLAMQMTRWFIILLAGPWVTVRLVQGIAIKRRAV